MHDDHDLIGHSHGQSLAGGAEQTTEEIEGLEMFRLRSVGIDIGSSTSHLVFSRLTLRREGASLSTRFRVTEREVLYRSRIILTPYVSGTLIDTEKIKQFVHDAYHDAGFTSEVIDTGAVIVTGEALKKENSRPIAELFAKDSGKFICVSAGHNHEALLAAYGCGAVALSQAEKAAVLNVDMGGGTTKFSYIQQGVVAETAAISVGARLIAFDEAGRVTRMEEPAKLILKEIGSDADLGKQISAEERERFAGAMARLLFEVIEGRPLSPLAKALMVTAPLERYPGLRSLDRLVFSGGVSEYVYERDRVAYGDVGPLLGAGVRQWLDKTSSRKIVREPAEGIRATVIGAGEYTIQASGSTSYISSTQALPAFGLKVIRPVIAAGDSVEASIRRALAKFDLAAFTSGLALAISFIQQANYQSLRAMADGIAAVVAESDSPGYPLFLVLDQDVAKSLGGILKEELDFPWEIVAVDGIDVGDLDYIDIGRPMGVSEVLPVTVKSLMFPSSRGDGAAGSQRPGA